jgi:hypothetical protein
VISALVVLAFVACTSETVEPPSGAASSPSPPATGSPTEQPSSDIQFVLRDRYPAGHRVPVRITNLGDEAYKYQTIYQACELEYRDPEGRMFLIPPGTHCDLVTIATIAPGETKLLFKWDLDECTRDEWGCVRSKPLDPGTYTINGSFHGAKGGVPAHAETSFTVTPPPDVTDYSTFISALDAQGHEVRQGERTGLSVPGFGIPGQLVSVDGTELSTFEFGTAQRLDAFRAGVSPEGDEIPTRHGRVIISWDPPRFYAAGKLLVLSFTDRADVTTLLDHLLGPPFAGA